MPISRVASTPSGRTLDGFTPALSTSNLSPPISRKSPSAIRLRAELPVQSMSTRFLSDMTTLLLAGRYNVFSLRGQRRRRPCSLCA